MTQQLRIFLDCDGVLADFDGGVLRALGAWPDQIRGDTMWHGLEDTADFYANLHTLSGGQSVYEAVKHLRPIILTGIPRGVWAIPQKLAWGTNHYPGVPMICCPTADKPLYAQPGDILIDDRIGIADKWNAVGGHFIHYRNAEDTLETLRDMGVIA